MHRKTISRELFTSMALVLLLSLALMCGIQSALSIAYFSNERMSALTSVLDGATALSNRFAAQGSDVTQPITDEALKENIESGFELFHTSSDAVIFITDSNGQIILHTEAADLTGQCVSEDVLDVLDSGVDYYSEDTLDGVFSTKYYTAGRRLEGPSGNGYLFVATSMDALHQYVTDLLSIFLVSAVGILLFASAISILFARKISAPIEQIGEAARQLGSGDFTARAPVDGCEELADFATTFNNMAARLQTIDNARGQFMGNIAHELRTPMTSIKGFIDGMLDGTIPAEEYKHYLGIVSQETGRLARLVQNMLDITKLESGEYKFQAKNCNIWDTITDVVLSDEKRIEDGKIDIQGLEPAKELVYADPDLIHQVVYNLVDNAIKFCPEGGQLTLRLYPDGAKAHVAVQNTGPTIDPEELPLLFDRFHKADKSRSADREGWGLGLYIAKAIVGAHGGDIWATSQNGLTSFEFTIPAAH